MIRHGISGTLTRNDNVQDWDVKTPDGAAENGSEEPASKCLKALKCRWLSAFVKEQEEELRLKQKSTALVCQDAEMEPRHMDAKDSSTSDNRHFAGHEQTPSLPNDAKIRIDKYKAEGNTLSFPPGEESRSSENGLEPDQPRALSTDLLRHQVLLEKNAVGDSFHTQKVLGSGDSEVPAGVLHCTHENHFGRSPNKALNRSLCGPKPLPTMKLGTVLRSLLGGRLVVFMVVA